VCNYLILGSWFGIGRGGKSCCGAMWKGIFDPNWDELAKLLKNKA